MPRMRILKVEYFSSENFPKTVGDILKFTTKHGVWYCNITLAGIYQFKTAGRSFYKELCQNREFDTDELIGRYLHLKKEIVIYKDEPGETLIPD